MNVQAVLDRAGIESKFLWHLAEIEKSWLKKGHLSTEYVGVPIPAINVVWRQNKQGKVKKGQEGPLSQ
jgi:hypothetical protein